MLNSPVEEIKNRLDIVEVIGSYIKLQKAGTNYRAVCPFHSEKKPSLFVSPVRQIWHCFGCGKGGDVFAFVKEIEGVEFGDALRILAQKAGVQLKKQDPKIRSERQRLYEICELTCRFFEKQLQDGKGGQEAKKYLLGRGISPESLKKWRVGYAPDSWQALSDFLESKGYTRKEIEKAGLGLTSEKGSFYDRFRGRIIFPISDFNSQVVGFGGRVFKYRDKDEVAKYVNTPQTLLYDKSRILYGLDKAKVEIRKRNLCILVEGYLDEIMSFQAGFENTLAVSGTALTGFQLKILKRYTDNLLTAFDMDVAGNTATKRGIDLAQLQGFNIKVVSMPEEKDPADIVAQDPKKWEKLVSEAKSILQFYFDSAFALAGNPDNPTPDQKREISKILLPVLKKIPNLIERSHWVQELARKLSVEEETIQREMEKTKDEHQREFGPQKEEPLKQEEPRKTRKELLEERIIYFVLKDKKITGNLSKDYFQFLSPGSLDILEKLKEGKEESLSQEDKNILDLLSLKSEFEQEDYDCGLEVEVCFKELKQIRLKERLDSISKELKKAEEEKNSEKVKQLTEEFRETANKLTNI